MLLIHKSANLQRVYERSSFAEFERMSFHQQELTGLHAKYALYVFLYYDP